MRTKHIPVPIGLAGRKGSGKDTAADLIMEYWSEPWKRAAFADPLRRIGYVFGFTDRQMRNPRCKERKDRFWGVSWRRFAQIVGTEMFRVIFRRDVWARFAERRMLEHPHRRFLFTDVRFAEEAEMIRKYGGIVIQIRRNTPKKDRHLSEQPLHPLLVDFTIENNSSLAHYEDGICELLDEHIYNLVKERDHHHARVKK